MSKSQDLPTAIFPISAVNIVFAGGTKMTDRVSLSSLLFQSFNGASPISSRGMGY